MKTEKKQENNGNKVLVGFKCNPILKQSLCHEANKLGITLSSHVETIVSVYENRASETGKLSEQIDDLKKRIAFYEESSLKEIYDQYKGKEISYVNKSNNKAKTTIHSIEDVFTVLINSFKTQK